MADDDIIYADDGDDQAGDDQAQDDDFYSLGNSTDDYWRFKNAYNNKRYYNSFDDDQYYSTKKATSWLDSLLEDTGASEEGQLTPVQDVNPDNVLATLWFNCFVCVTLLGLYELLRRWIPSVYSQRLVYGNETYNGGDGGVRDSGSGEGCNGGGHMMVMETAIEACIDSQFVRDDRRLMVTVASGRSLRGLGSLVKDKSSEEEGDRERGGSKEAGADNGEEAVDDDENSLTNACNNLRQEVCTGVEKSRANVRQSIEQGEYSWKCCKRTCAFPILEWCVPVHNTSWTTLRHIAGLDAYFYLRYIRMCLKITAVSSFWAIIILCPVYATGGGNQSGFYHFSMANVLQNDKGRVWVPTIFCWLFTMYCWFCVRAEMMHYVELRMEFLGGEEEQRILQKRESMRESMKKGGGGDGGSGSRDGQGVGGGYGAPKEIHGSSTTGGAGLREGDVGGYGTSNEDVSIVTTRSSDDSGTDQQRSRSRSPLLSSDGELVVSVKSGLETADAATESVYASTRHPSNRTLAEVQKQIKQHRYSLQVEKVPVELRSNTALFNYFNEMFPNQVHSAHITMNVPDLDALSARRMRVCRRLEKSLAYYSVTGIRPTHIAGRPRCRCCGIESTPIDGWCVAFCCCYDSCRMKTYRADRAEEEDRPEELYETLPDKGECVDSILYYTLELAKMNLKMRKLQQQQFRIAETGNSAALWGAGGVGSDESNCDWYAQPLGMLKRGAAMTAEGLRDEFEVSGEEDYLGDGVAVFSCGNGAGYGSMSISYTSSNDGDRVRNRSLGKKARLVEEDHLSDSDDHGYGVNISRPCTFPSAGGSCEDFGVEAARQRKIRYHRPYTWLRALLWRMGVDFLAAGLDEVRNRTDVVVDSVTRPSMSSTGFVTFKTLTPVTVTTSAPLTYNRNPMEVSIAPEPRDLVWQNVQIDQDIGSSRSFFANVLLGLGVLLWSIPLTLIQAWAKVENVSLIPGLEWVDQIHGGTWKSLINGYLPVITLLGLILLLPLIFQWVATSYEKRKTLSGVQNSIVGRYFYYQLANIYITVTAGALWTSLAEIIDHPQQLLVILGNTLPKLAGYFISLLITKTLAGLPMVLLRVGALSRMMFLRSCFNKKRLTERELREVYRKQPIFYGWEYPTQFLVIIICFTYACITPFVLPVGAVYFFFALLVYKKQALYVYTPTYESGGRMFPQAVSKTLFALLISQMTFIGYTLIRKGVFQIILLAPLPFLTVFFTLFIQHRFVEPSKKLSLERAVKIDALLDQSPEFSHEAYQQPVLTEKASVPVCETNGFILAEVIENLDRLQNESTSDSEASSSLGVIS